MKSIAILGAGSAGILAASHFNTFLGEEWKVTTIHSDTVPILGIGESTNPSFLTNLEMGTGFSHLKELEKLDGTFKLGTTYYWWRDNAFTNPFIDGNLAIHMDTASLNRYALPKMIKLWKGYSVEVGLICEVQDKGNLVEVYIDGRKDPMEFDYVVDCRGFPKEGDREIEWIDKPLLDSCIVYDQKETNDPSIMYTTGHIATSNGWMFEVPLSSRTSYGYLFNSKSTTEEDALLDMSDILQVPINEKVHKKFKFSPYYRKEVLKGRILYNGNSAVFFEPMFANSLWLYDNINKGFIDYLEGSASLEEFNRDCTCRAMQVYHTIALHYVGGSSKYSTPFWITAKNSAREILNTASGLEYRQDLAENVNKAKKCYAGLETPIFPVVAWVAMLDNLEYYIDEEIHE